MKLLLLLLALGSTTSIAPENLAWWLTIQLEPTGRTYRGVAVENLSTPLARLSLLSCQPEARQFTHSQCQEIKSNGALFRVSGDFNHDGIAEIAETGVGLTRDGTKVRVLIISDQHNPQLNQVFMAPANGFSVLYPEEESLFWYTCMECGHPEEVKWDCNGRRYQLLLGEDYGVQPSNNSFKPNPLRGFGFPDRFGYHRLRTRPQGGSA